MEGSLTSDTPSLLSLPGNDTFTPQAADPQFIYITPGGTPDPQGGSLADQPKFSGALVAGLNGSVVGLQLGGTTLSSYEGPTQSMEVRKIEGVGLWDAGGCSVHGRGGVGAGG